MCLTNKKANLATLVTLVALLEIIFAAIVFILVLAGAFLGLLSTNFYIGVIVFIAFISIGWEILLNSMLVYGVNTEQHCYITPWLTSKMTSIIIWIIFDLILIVILARSLLTANDLIPVLKFELEASKLSENSIKSVISELKDLDVVVVVAIVAGSLLWTGMIISCWILVRYYQRRLSTSESSPLIETEYD